MESGLIPCVKCAHDISPEAASCPNCGHPRDQDLFGRFEKVKKVGGFVLIVISIILIGIQATVVKAIGLSNAPGTPEVTFATVFLQTAPFTIAVTIIALVLYRDESSRKVWEGILLAAVVLAASFYLNAWLTGKQSETSVLGNPIMVVLNTLTFYWDLYGPSLFVSSLILGGFLAWAIDHLWPEAAQKS